MTNPIENMPILYSFKRCPYAIRARMALGYAKINHIHREIDLKNKHPDFLKTSPKGTVPVLVDPDQQQVIDESVDIVRYALTKHQPKDWLPVSVVDQIQNAKLFNDMMQTFVPAVRKIKYGGAQDEEHEAVETARKFLNTIESQVADKQHLLDAPSALDILCFPNIRQLAIHDGNWLSHHDLKHVENWINFWCKSNIFETIFVNQPTWNPELDPIVIKHK